MSKQRDYPADATLKLSPKQFLDLRARLDQAQSDGTREMAQFLRDYEFDPMDFIYRQTKVEVLW